MSEVIVSSFGLGALGRGACFMSFGWLRDDRFIASVLADRVLLFLVAVFPIFFMIGDTAAEIALNIIIVLFIPIVIFRRWASVAHNQFFLVCLLVWASLIFLNYFFSQDVVSTKYALIWLRFVLFGFAVAYVVSDVESGYKYVLIVLAACYGFVVVDMWFEYAFGYDLLGKATAVGQRLYGPYRDLVGGRFTVLYFFPLIGFLLFKSVYKLNYRLLSLALCLIFVQILTSFIAGSRMPFLLLGLGLAVLIPWVLYGRYKFQSLYVSMFILVLASFTAYFLMPEQSERMVLQLVNSLSHFHQSSWGMVMIDGLEVWKHYPLTGIGIKNFDLICDSAMGFERSIDLMVQGKKCFSHPHNFVIEWGLSHGLVGIFLYLLFILSLIYFFASTFQSGSQHSMTGVAKGALVSVLVLFWPIASTSSFFGSFNGTVVWHMIGLAMGFVLFVSGDQKVRD